MGGSDDSRLLFNPATSALGANVFAADAVSGADAPSKTLLSSQQKLFIPPTCPRAGPWVSVRQGPHLLKDWGEMMCLLDTPNQ